MLVLSPKAFAERTELVIGLPLTHAESNANHPFAVAIQGPKKEVGYILCHQPKSFDWEARGGGRHPWAVVPKSIIREALDSLDAIWGNCEH